jgi:methionyl-tRNA formyltransferase
MKQSIKIAFFGNERIATGVTTNTPTLKRLVNEGYEVVAVISNYEKPSSRKTRQLEIAQTAESLGIPFYTPVSTKELLQILEKLKPDIGILVAYGKIVPESVIHALPLGIINIHPSKLPEHRGASPIEATILEGSRNTAVSIMMLVADMDAGPIYAQTPIEVAENATKQELANTLLEVGSETLIDVLPSIVSESCAMREQDHSKASYDGKITKEDGIIDWQKDANRLTREIRAYAAWPRSRARLGKVDVIITAASESTKILPPGKIEIHRTGEILVGCKKGSLIIEKLQPVGKQEMNAINFINGYGGLLAVDS